jgi:hypothetical protein
MTHEESLEKWKTALWSIARKYVKQEMKKGQPITLFEILDITEKQAEFCHSRVRDMDWTDMK